MKLRYWLSALLLMAIVPLMMTTVVLSINAQNTKPSSLTQNRPQTINTLHSIRFNIPYTASNNDRTHPFTYTFKNPITESWILNIQNNLSYASRPDAKVVIKLQEPQPSQKFIEIAMYGSSASYRFWAAVNEVESGYIRLYDKSGIDGWSPANFINVGYDSNQGLSINSGVKVLIDRLSVNGFTLGSVSVYGKEDTNSPLNTYSGSLSFQTFWGKPSDSPIYYLPLVMSVGVGGLIVALLVFKKREKVEAS